MAAPSRTPSTVTLTWNPPGDDGLVGVAALQKIRYSTAPITAGNFGAATPLENPPAPNAKLRGAARGMPKRA